MKDLPYFDDRRALQAHVVKRRQEGATWKAIKAELSTDDGNYYYIYYLRGITPHAVGGYSPDDFDPEAGRMVCVVSSES